MKLLGIFRFPDGDEMCFALKVEWLIRKSDIPAVKYAKYIDHISVAEVFESGQSDFVPIESIMRKSYLMTLD